MIKVEVLADSLNMETGDRLTTIEAVYPRVIHSELKTHRVFSTNSSSSRAIPIQKMIEDVKQNPYIPRAFGLKQKGMQPKKFLTAGENWSIEYQHALDWWSDSMWTAIERAEEGAELGLHKQIVNRILEPYQHITTIISATDWDNFLELRTELDESGNPMADIPIYDLAMEVKKALDTHQPNELEYGQWHEPLAGGDGYDELSAVDQHRVSIARIARTSYLNTHGSRPVEKELELYWQLSNNKHLTPLEHIATATEAGRHANFSGFKSHRAFWEEGRVR